MLNLLRRGCWWDSTERRSSLQFQEPVGASGLVGVSAPSRPGPATALPAVPLQKEKTQAWGDGRVAEAEAGVVCLQATEDGGW